MNRFVIATAIAGASCAIAVPAVAGLSGNPSLSQSLPVRAPMQAQRLQFDSHGQLLRVAGSRCRGDRLGAQGQHR